MIVFGGVVGMIKIEKLVTEEEYFDEVVSWNYELWYKQEKWSNDKVKVYMQQSLNSSQLPITLIALEEKEVVGTCQLSMNDLDVRPQYYPWLINLSVIETKQGKGIGLALVKNAIEEAKRLNYQELYLYTEHKGFFEKLGFEFIEVVEVDPGTKQFVRIYKWSREMVPSNEN